MKDLVFRLARKEDAPAMSRLDRLCFAIPWAEDAFCRELEENPAAFYVVAEKAGELVGYAGFWKVLDEGHITNVAVRSDLRRAGIGRELMALLIREGEARGVQSFTLEVRASNEAAIGLYRSFGFGEAGRRRAYYADNKEDAVIMWRSDL